MAVILIEFDAQPVHLSVPSSTGVCIELVKPSKSEFATLARHPPGLLVEHPITTEMRQASDEKIPLVRMRKRLVFKSPSGAMDGTFISTTQQLTVDLPTVEI